MLLSDGSAVADIGGLALVALAVILAISMLNTTFQRIVGEERSMLDEFELSLRAKAMETAYAMLAGLVVTLCIYGAIATDKGGWMPGSYDHWNALFWGLFLYASLLPTAILAWQVGDTDLVAA